MWLVLLFSAFNKHNKNNKKKRGIIMTNTRVQNYDLFYNTIKSLSHSQGSYGRLLRGIDSLSEDDKQNLINQLPDFKDTIDVVLWLEQ